MHCLSQPYCTRCVLMLLLVLLQSQPVLLWLHLKDSKKCAFLLPPCLVVVGDPYVCLVILVL